MKKDALSAKKSTGTISPALDIVGDRWCLLILRDLMFTEKRTYSELLLSEEGIATNILAARLLRLEENGIIRKSAHPTDGRKSIYLLTEKGIGLLPVLIELNFWMAEHDPAGIICIEKFRYSRGPKEEIISVETARLRQEHLI